MKDTIHFQLLAAQTLFQKTFLSEIKKILSAFITRTA